MTSDLDLSIQNAHVRIGCDQCEWASHCIRRNGVIVEIEAHVDNLARMHGFDPVGCERMQSGAIKCGCSSANASATVRSSPPGQRRWCAI